MIDDTGKLKEIITREDDGFGPAAIGRAVTATLRVSPDGTGVDGQSWATAYQTIQDALDAASTDVNDATLILIAPQTGGVHYDINRTGDPTWSANVILKGVHRTWVKIMNDHDTATSIMNLTGYASLIDLNFNLGTSNNGVKFTKGAFRAKAVQFVGEDLTSAKTALHLDGASTIKHGKIVDCYFKGHTDYMTAMLIDNCELSRFEDLYTFECLKGIQIIDAGSINNTFDNVNIYNCSHANGIGIDIDAGDEQHFNNIRFNGNTLNIDDEVDGHQWNNVNGQFPITIDPDDMTGVTLTADNVANVFGADTELRAAALATKPFKVVMTILEPQIAQWYQLRLSADSGATFFERIMVSTARAAGSGLPSSTDYIFNVGTRISGSIKAESGGSDTMKVWLKIQEI